MADRNDTQYVTESMLHACMSYGRGGADLNGHQLFQPIPNVPLLTNGQMVDHIPFLGNTKEIILKVLISL